MNDFIYNIWFIYKEYEMIGTEEKPRNKKRIKNKGKNSLFVCPPIPPDLVTSVLRSRWRVFMEKGKSIM